MIELFRHSELPLIDSKMINQTAVSKNGNTYEKKYK